MGPPLINLPVNYVLHCLLTLCSLPFTPELLLPSAYPNQNPKPTKPSPPQELFKYKGQQIAPAELEAVLITHPKILEAAIVGIPLPDDPGSEVPRAYLIPKSPLTEDEVKAFVSERMAPYKQLRGGVKFVEELPKNAIGKILRRELRERAKRELGLVQKGSKL